ncbi:cytochrome c oxidase assembly protein COX18, mitochondrial isoform X2 [Anser cygnoides]|uniref:cytochrome c oxidase assembly protein COX18, mitochondrial isoform X2 n=1 Tax=Anser cygnoides TaxID=8845 RepID=UPI0034D17BBE
MAAQARHLTLPPRPVHARGPDGTVGGLRARRTLRMWRLARRGPPLTVAAVVAASASGSPGGWYGWLAQTAPVHWAEGGLVALQAAAELPWWAAIVCGGAALRTAVTLPLAAHQSRLLAKLENLQPEIKKLSERLRYEVSVRGKQLGWSDKVARFHFKKNLRRIITELYIRDNCHPFKATLLVWVQIPMWVFVSLALRNCSVGALNSEVQEQFSTGGTLWFTDLTAPDSTWILPVSLGLLNLLIVEIFASQKMEVSRFQKLATNFFRVLSVVMIPVAATVPSVFPSFLRFQSEVVLLFANMYAVLQVQVSSFVITVRRCIYKILYVG